MPKGYYHRRAVEVHDHFMRNIGCLREKECFFNFPTKERDYASKIAQSLPKRSAKDWNQMLKFQEFVLSSSKVMGDVRKLFVRKWGPFPLSDAITLHVFAGFVGHHFLIKTNRKIAYDL